MYILFINSGGRCDIFFSAQFNNNSNKKKLSNPWVQPDPTWPMHTPTWNWMRNLQSGASINGLFYAINKRMTRQICIEKPIHSATHNYILIKLKILKHTYMIQTRRTAPPMPKPIPSPLSTGAPPRCCTRCLWS